MLSTSLLFLATLAQSTPDAPTWSSDIAPLVHNHCAECHRPGEAAPFPLLEYRDVQKRAVMLQAVMEDRTMPPWHPVEGHGSFVGKRGLSAEELELFDRWIEAGRPAGDLANAPEPPVFESEWTLGEPDLVLEMAEGFPVPKSGPDIYRNFCLPLGLEEDRWIRAIEVRPGVRSVVHHVLFFSDDTGRIRRADEADPVPGFDGMGAGGGSNPLGGWAVGGAPYALPEPLAMPLPKGSDLMLQTHFHPSGKEEVEKTRIGIYFADEPPKRVVSVQLPPQYAAFHGLDVPAGESAFTLRDSMVLPVDTELYTVGAHAHYLGKTMRAWAVLPDGTEQRLFLIDDWDFNWQGRYLYREPVTLPAGTRLEAEIVYDNSADNPHNPSSPPRRVTWGLESMDEMGAITWVATAKEAADSSELRKAVSAKFREARRNRRRVTVDWYARVMRLDADGDGKLSKDEIPDRVRGQLERLDKDGDGELSAEELESLKGRGR